MEESDIRLGMIPQEGNCINTFVIGFERTRLPRTQQEDTLFTITR